MTANDNATARSAYGLWGVGLCLLASAAILTMTDIVSGTRPYQGRKRLLIIAAEIVRAYPTADEQRLMV